MSHAESLEKSMARGPRSLSLVMAFVVGVPLGAGILALIHMGPFRHPFLVRYTSHPVEMVTVILFGCAVGALLTKLASYGAERMAFRAKFLPHWDGVAVPASAARSLLHQWHGCSRAARATWLGRRIANVLDFVHSRGAADDLDDQLRALTDDDDIALDNSYALVRFITWAIPILGFLGTVLGITGAISGVDPDVLEKNLRQVTDGLGVAFDTTAVALALTMVVMFLSFVMERMEQNLLDRVNGYVEEQLAHRFERGGVNGGEFAEALRRNSDILLQATDRLVQQQVQLWNATLEESQRQWLATGQHQQQTIAAGLEQAMQRTVTYHAEQLAQQEKQSQQVVAGTLSRLEELTSAVQDNAQAQQQSVADLMHRVTEQTAMLAQLAESGNQLTQLQETMQHNLNVLAGSGTFEQAVSSLTAAIHLLTTRVNSTTAANHNAPRSGAAA